jgi:hypothetical protein
MNDNEDPGAPPYLQFRDILDRAAYALSSRSFLIFYCGVCTGALLTAGLAYVWSFAP